MYLLVLTGLAGIAAWILYPRSASASIVTSNITTGSILGDYYSMQNIDAFLGLIRWTESQNRYDVIAGGDKFTDFREHPFVLNPERNKPLGTTASGAYQMVVGTWKMARDALALPNFSPASQDKAAIWIIMNKRKGSYDAIARGDFKTAIELLRGEWEAFDKMLKGQYPITLTDAQAFFTNNGGIIT